MVFPHPYNKIPTVVVSSGKYNGSADAAKFFTVRLWEVSATGFTARIFDERDSSWSDRQLAYFSWIAI